MSNRRRAVLMSAICCASLLAVGAANAESLADALTAAYQTNPTLLSARSTQRTNDEAYVQSLARLGPQASLTVSQTASFDGNSRTDDVPTGTFSLSITQPLSTGGTLNRNISNAELTVLSGRDQLRASEATLMQQVISAYTNILLNQDSLTIAQSSLVTSQQEADQNDAKYAVGLITRTDVEQSRAALASAQTRLENAKNTLANSRATYAVLVGQNPGDIEIAPTLPNVPSSFEEALQIAQQWSPAWRQALYADRQSEIALANAEHTADPQVALSAGYGSQANPLNSGGVRNFFDRDSANASVSLSVPLFTSGLNGSNIRIAREARQRSTYNVETTRRQLEQSVQTDWNALVNARATITTSQAALDAQTLATEGMREQVNQGLNTTFDLLTQEDNLRTDQLAVINAHAQEYLAEATLLQVIGRLEAKYLIPDAVEYDPLANFNRVKTKAFVPPYAPVVLAADKLFSPSLNAPKAGDEAPSAQLNSPLGEPELATMAPHPDAATIAAAQLPADTAPVTVPATPAPTAAQITAGASALDSTGAAAVVLPSTLSTAPGVTTTGPAVTPAQGAAAAGRGGARGAGAGAAGAGAAAGRGGAGRGAGGGGRAPGAAAPAAGQ